MIIHEKIKSFGQCYRENCESVYQDEAYKNFKKVIK